MANQEKMHRLCETDLAIAAMLSGDAQRDFIVKASSGRPYPFYRSVRSLYSTILSVAALALVPSADTLKKAVSRKCKKGRKGEIPGNQAIAGAVREYALAHGITGVEFEFHPVHLGRAGNRTFWAPFILQIDGKRYIPYFDPRKGGALTTEACQFIFSVNHTHIRKSDAAKFGDVGFVIFQFEVLRNGARRIVARFDAGTAFLSDRQIGERIDGVYRTVDAIEATRSAEAEKKAG